MLRGARTGPIPAHPAHVSPHLSAHISMRAYTYTYTRAGVHADRLAHAHAQPGTQVHTQMSFFFGRERLTDVTNRPIGRTLAAGVSAARTNARSRVAVDSVRFPGTAPTGRDRGEAMNTRGAEKNTMSTGFYFMPQHSCTPSPTNDTPTRCFCVSGTENASCR